MPSNIPYVIDCSYGLMPYLPPPKSVRKYAKAWFKKLVAEMVLAMARFIVLELKVPTRIQILWTPGLRGMGCKAKNGTGCLDCV